MFKQLPLGMATECNAIPKRGRLLNRAGLSTNSALNDKDSNKIFEIQKEEVLLTIKELAGKLGCSISYIKKLKANGAILPVISMGRFVRYKFSEVVVALQKRSVL